VAQQARNLPIALDDRAGQLRLLLRDRDAKFTAAFDAVFAAEATKVPITPVRAPRADASAARWAGTVRRELLDRMLSLGRSAAAVGAGGARQPVRPAPPAPRALGRRRDLGPACRLSWCRLRGSRDEVASVG
jgi:hypothetical protein